MADDMEDVYGESAEMASESSDEQAARPSSRLLGYSPKGRFSLPGLGFDHDTDQSARETSPTPIVQEKSNTSALHEQKVPHYEGAADGQEVPLAPQDLAAEAPKEKIPGAVKETASSDAHEAATAEGPEFQKALRSMPRPQDDLPKDVEINMEEQEVPISSSENQAKVEGETEEVEASAARNDVSTGELMNKEVLQSVPKPLTQEGLPKDMDMIMEEIEAPIPSPKNEAKVEAKMGVTEANESNHVLNEGSSKDSPHQIPADVMNLAELITQPPLEGSDAANAEDGAEAEFEEDSSPYESSSDDSSISSSDDSDGSEEEYELLSPEEQARRLMENDGASDEESAPKANKGAPLRTHNEKPDEVVEVPNIVVTEEMKIEELGNVETIVDNVALIKAKTSGEYQVLESSSLLCLEDRKVVGVVAETLGRVQEPLYCLRFANATAMQEAGVSKGVTVYYVPDHSTFVFTKAIQAIKGSDASNIHDEEVGQEEVEFSDDEAEAEYRRKLKMQKQARRAGAGPDADPQAKKTRGRTYREYYGRDKRTLTHDGEVDHSMGAINYDDGDGQEELYTPLARPANLQEMMESNKHITGGPPDVSSRGGSSRAGRSSRGRGDRGDRSRGGGRGRGERRSYNNARSFKGSPQTLDLSLPPTPNFGFSNGPGLPAASVVPPRPQAPSWMPPPPFPQPAPPSPSYGQSQPPPQHNFTHPLFPPQAVQAPHSINQWQGPQPPSYQNANTQYYPPYQAPTAPGHPQYQQPLHPQFVPPNIPPGSAINPRFFQGLNQQGSNQQGYNPGPPRPYQ